MAMATVLQGETDRSHGKRLNQVSQKIPSKAVGVSSIGVEGYDYKILSSFHLILPRGGSDISKVSYWVMPLAFFCQTLTVLIVIGIPLQNQNQF